MIYAGFWVRFVAKCVDIIILGLMSMPLCVYFYLNGMLFDTYIVFDNTYLFFTITALVSLLIYIVIAGLIYNVLFNISRFHATPGKIMVGLKVVRNKNKQITILRAATRYFFEVVSVLLLFSGFLLIGKNPYKQSLHDKIIGSLVIVHNQKRVEFTKHFFRKHAILFALIILVLSIGILEPFFISPINISNFLRQVTLIGIIAIGMTMTIIASGIAGIDLSVGSIVGLSAVMVSVLIQYGLHPVVAIILTILSTGVFVGLWNGYWSTRFKIPAFIVTLGMMTMARGFALIISGETSIAVSNDLFLQIGGGFLMPGRTNVLIILIYFLYLYIQVRELLEKIKYNIHINRAEWLFNCVFATILCLIALYVFNNNGIAPDNSLTARGIPVQVFIFILLAFLSIFILRYTKLGRRIYAIGGNDEAALISGINVVRTQLLVYVFVSVLASLSGIILCSRLGGASPNLGLMIELDVIAAVVIGGVSLSGGSGTIVGPIYGVLILVVLGNGMNQLEIPTRFQFVIKGLIITIAVWFDMMSKRQMKKNDS